jgi:hypothetical protein
MNFKVAGWSRGYVGFSVQVLQLPDWAGDATIATTYSSDGVHWHEGTVLQHRMSNDNLDIRGVFEGPSGLLAVGESGACGDAWIEALWTSRDGIAWQSVDTKKAFGNATIENVSGGSRGFVAVDSTGRAAWTSRDGQSWQPVRLGVPAFARSRIDDGTAFSGGYVLAGSTEVTGARGCGAITVDPSVSPSPAPPLRLPAIWWSPDGGTWTKAELPGGTPAYWVQMSICRANDRTLIAFESYNSDQNSGNALWISNDGRTWRFAGPSGFYPSEILTDGQHGVLIEVHDPVDSSPGSTAISMLTDDGGLVAPAQEGDRPPYAWNEQWAVGPTGILVTDGSQLWIGLPSEG